MPSYQKKTKKQRKNVRNQTRKNKKPVKHTKIKNSGKRITAKLIRKHPKSFSEKLRKSSSIPQIDGVIIDKEHADIDNAFANLLKIVKGHWKTEDRLFKEGLNKIPLAHHSVVEEIEKHKKAHADGIEKIEQLRAAIHKHIQEYDVPHFHWLK